MYLNRYSNLKKKSKKRSGMSFVISSSVGAVFRSKVKHLGCIEERYGKRLSKAEQVRSQELSTASSSGNGN